MIFIYRLAQVTDDPVVQRTSPVNIIRKGSHENCRDRVARSDEASVKFEPGHRRHVDVRNQAGCFDETRGREEIGRRWENLDGITQ